MSQDNAAKINLSGVRKTFAGGKKVVLDHVDLEIGKGESVVIIGGSGTGKSVTIKCMLGLLKPDSGSITIDGKDVNNMFASEREDINQQVGMLFQAARVNRINLKKSYMIGDRTIDILCGQKAGCKTIFINRKYKEKKPINQIVSVKNLKEATNCIINTLEK